MECTARILRERTTFKGEEKETAILFYCPIIGEIAFYKDVAERVRKNMKEKLSEEGRAEEA